VKLTVVRTQMGTDATNGILLVDGLFECYTLEDQYQAVKVMHETCIPEGTYNIKFRTVGGFHTKYKERYGNAHYGMLHLQDVPNFTYILIHTGNSDEVAKELLLGKEVSIEYTTITKLLQKPLSNASTDDVVLARTVMDKLQELKEDISEVNGNVITNNAMLKGRLIQ